MGRGSGAVGTYLAVGRVRGILDAAAVVHSNAATAAVTL